MSATDAAYLAGLIDADGSIGLYRKKRNGGAQYNVQLGISNTRIDLLAWVLEVTGGVGGVHANRPETETCKATYQYLAQNRSAWSVLQQTMPYMRVKNDRAAMAKNALDAMASGDYAKVDDLKVLFTLANQTGPRRH